MTFNYYFNTDNFINIGFPQIQWNFLPMFNNFNCIWNNSFMSTYNNNFSFNQPSLNWNFDTFTSTIAKPTSTTSSTSLTSSASTTQSTTQTSSTKNIQWWIDRGYNPQKGQKLCAATKRHLDANPIMSNGKRKITGECVGFVRKGINDAFYNGEIHYPQFGKAYLCGEEYLSKDKNFKKLTGIDMSQINPADIPEGAIVLYNPGYSSGKGSYCGHGEVSNGNGQGYSDVLTYLRNSGNKTIREIWLPV